MNTRAYAIRLQCDTMATLFAIATRHLRRAKHPASARCYLAEAAWLLSQGDTHGAKAAALHAVYLAVGNSHPDYRAAHDIAQTERLAA